MRASRARPCTRALLAACLRAGFSPRLGQEAPRITSALGLVAAGLGVALVPDSMRRMTMEGVAYRPLAGTAPVAVLAIVLRRDLRSAAARNFLALARRQAGLALPLRRSAAAPPARPASAPR
ncbi:LysR substrate-binding domain-containing protein [Dankookia sp. P2]|uniref:LysR substrate-binding domain-containing protein n=1 Tax=Dankookia sp. P2 TaxID=3423955 RepID=UPI003D66E71D